MGSAGSNEWGDTQHLFAPAQIGRDFDFAATSQLAPLEEFRDYLTIISGTDCRMAEAYRAEEIGGDHDRSTGAGLASSLIFEFTQADLATHDRGTERNLAQLSELGFRFSVDGVTSLDIDVESLIQRRISFLKIDAGTALETLQDADASLQLHRMKRALDRAGINLIVEKIEQEEQLIELLDYGIDFGQGYLFGTPRLSREA